MMVEKRIVFETKASTLESVGKVIQKANVLPMVRFSVKAWRCDPNCYVNRILESFGEVPLVVRSSALDEDTYYGSNAGAYLSLKNVQGAKEIHDAVGKVIDSYETDSGDNEVFVQPQLVNVKLAGVAFSHDPSTGSPYRVINYSDKGDTDLVTSGMGLARTKVIAAGKACGIKEFDDIVSLLEELADLVDFDSLDIEFAWCADPFELYLLQVRPLNVNSGCVNDFIHSRLLSRIHRRVTQVQQPHVFLYGSRTVLGVMPDWNPAEIIGVRPRPLSLSLYQDLITDSIWAYQRNNYGYKNLRSFPLVVSLGGQPFVDVRVSFNSFLPKEIEGRLAERLVDYYIDSLIKMPALHDKVEFEIVFSCYSFDLDMRLAKLIDHGFSYFELAELKRSLLFLTNKIIGSENALWLSDANKLNSLVERRKRVLDSELDPLSKIYWLLEDCKRYGTLPFAGLARAGFIAVQLLRSLVNVGAFTEHDFHAFMLSINTVSKRMAHDFHCKSKEGFLSEYGHLRPGTYDICSPRYDESPALYFSHVDCAYIPDSSPEFCLTAAHRNKIGCLLIQHGLNVSVDELIYFIKSAIELREYSKFLFTKNLSDALALYKRWGQGLGFSVEDLSYSDIKCVQKLYSGWDDPYSLLEDSISEGKRRYRESCQLWLPSLITKPDDVYNFELTECEPNYVTLGQARGEAVQAEPGKSLNGKIVLIKSADPGYDWVFSHGIAGLITAYGGVNSHMAIRANEQNIPAVIGVGEALFSSWSKAKVISIDCAAKRVEALV